MLCSLSSHSRDFLLQILAVEVNLHGNLQKKTIEALKRILRNSVFCTAAEPMEMGCHCGKMRKRLNLADLLVSYWDLKLASRHSGQLIL